MKNIAPEKVIEIVLNYHGITKKQMLSGRKRAFVEPKHLAIYFIHKYSYEKIDGFIIQMTLSKIGMYFDDLHHATVIHAVDTVNKLRFYQDYNKAFNELDTLIKQHTLFDNLKGLYQKRELLLRDLDQVESLIAKMENVENKVAV